MTRPRTSQPGQLVQTISLSPDAGEPPAEAPSFWERIYSITPDEWASKYCCYLYRGKASLEKITHPFDPDWVKQRYGGGDFRALLNDDRYKMVASHSFTIEGPPRPGPNEAQTSAPPAPAAGDQSFQAQVLSVIQESNRQTQEMLRDMISQLRQPAPAAVSSEANPILLKGVVDMFTGMMPKQQNVIELLGLVKTLMPVQEKVDLLSLLKQAKELGLIPAAAAGGGTMLEQLDSLLAVAEKLGGRAGDKPASVMAILAEKAPEIVERIGGIADKWATIAKANREAEYFRLQRSTVTQPQPAVGNAPMLVPPGSPMPPATAVPAMELEPVNAPGAPAVGQGAIQPAAPLDEIDRMKQKIVEGIMRGSTGADIVSFIDMVAPALVNTFIGVSEKDLAGFFQNDPILQAAVQLPRFPDVIREIVDELADVGEEEPEGTKPN